MTCNWWEFFFFGSFSQNNNKRKKRLLSSGSYFKVSVVSRAGPWAWTSVRGRAGCMRTPHPSYDSSLMRIRNVFPDLRMGLDAVLAFQGRVLESSVVSPEPAGLGTETFSSDAAGAIMLSCTRAIVCYRCCLNGPSNCLCVQFIILLAAQVFSRLYDIICFIFIMRFGNPLDIALSDHQHDLVCLFSSDSDGAVGLKPGEHFNYNHSITTLCFQVKGVDCHKESRGICMPTITCNYPSTPC